MIRFVTTDRNTDPVRQFRAHAAGAYGERIAVARYGTISPGAPADAPSAWIFTDLESLSIAQLHAATRLWTALARDPRNRMLNHPARVMRRYELLRMLRETGLNDFDAYRMTERRQPARYPVFLRRESEHTGARSPLIHDDEALARFRDNLLSDGHIRDDVLVVEYSDVRDPDGYWRKYSAYGVAGQVVAVELIVADHWVAKLNRRVRTPETYAEEMAYLESNPHATILREVFARARIDYGRIDYSVTGGRIRVWEINTNPSFVSADGPPPHRLPAHTLGAARLTAALAAIDPEPFDAALLPAETVAAAAAS